MQITEGLHDRRKINILSAILLSCCTLTFQTGTPIMSSNATTETIFNNWVTHLSAKFKTEGKALPRNNKKGLHYSLILCENCFWCTSIISIKWDIVICPSCCSNALEVIQISSVKSYTIDFTTNGGVRMNFRRRAIRF